MTRRIRLPLGAVALTGLAVALVLPRAFTTAQPVPLAQPPAPNPAVVAVQKVLPHPLDPLSADEIATAVEVVRAANKVPKAALLPLIVRNEPAKATVLAHKPGDPFPREAFLIVLDRPAGKTFEAVVDLTAKKLTSFAERKGVQPSIVPEEFTTVATIVRGDERWQAAMAKRGLKKELWADEKQVEIHGWAAGFVPGQEGRRVVRAITYFRGGTDNPYSRPVEGVIALVDLTAGKVVTVLDDGDTPIAADAFDYFDPRRVGALRPALTPLEVHQPKGANFELHGNEVRWQNWSLRHAVHPREGLVLYAVSYKDGPTVRPILYRASLSEMLVPYGDPSAAWRWRNAFDVGEYGMGPSLTPLRPGYEVPETATVLPVALADDFGKPYAVEKGVAVYEQDGGTLWTHSDFFNRRTETRRARQLVLHTLYTIGNYDYGLRWIFGQDGAIEVQIELTGVMLIKGVREKKCVVCQQGPDADGRFRPQGADRNGAVVAPQVVATHHQHFFNFRLDFDVEGVRNTVHEMELVPEPPLRTNPERNGILLEQRQLRTEREARRDLEHRSHRTWKVLNPNRQTALGHFPGYELLSSAGAVPLAHPEATVRKQAGFADHHVWVTRYKAGELYAAGDYPNQNAGGDGLPRFGDDNEPLVNEDVVLWHTAGVSHAPRAEEWPVMPVSRTGFRLVPHNFFARNPALDVR